MECFKKAYVLSGRQLTRNDGRVEFLVVNGWRKRAFADHLLMLVTLASELHAVQLKVEELVFDFEDNFEFV